MLIGGQAVNYWAGRYLRDEPELKDYLPFTSGDIDYQGNREDVRHIAGQLEREAIFPDKVSLTALAGTIPFRIGGQRSNIEVVWQIPGVASAAVDALAVGAELAGRQIRVLDPISLLCGKVNLALTIPQKDRQDVAHTKILVLCVRGFLRDALMEVERGHLPAKGWLGAVNRLVNLVKSTHGRKAAKKFGIHWPNLLPLKEITACKNPKITAFRNQQMLRGFGLEAR